MREREHENSIKKSTNNKKRTETNLIIFLKIYIHVNERGMLFVCGITIKFVIRLNLLRVYIET